MATVTCRYCGKKFDRDKEAYVQVPLGKTFRYGHANCYLEAVNSGKEKQTFDIWDPAHSTTCFWCHQAIYPNQPDNQGYLLAQGKGSRLRRTRHHRRQARTGSENHGRRRYTAGL